MPSIIAIETSSEYCSVALLGAGCDVARSVHALHEHSELVLPMVSAILHESRLTLSDCAAVAFGAGPGSFTGLRIACSVSQGLAFGAGLPTIPVGTLEAIAEEALGPCDRLEGVTVLVVQDARMGEVYWSLMQWDMERWVALHPASLSRPEELRSQITQLAHLGAGNGFALAPSILEPLVMRYVPVEHADARAIAVLARKVFLRGQLTAPEDASPLYVRDRVALTTAERQAKATFA